jgi:hypothetical protein
MNETALLRVGFNDEVDVSWMLDETRYIFSLTHNFILNGDYMTKEEFENIVNNYFESNGKPQRIFEVVDLGNKEKPPLVISYFGPMTFKEFVKYIEESGIVSGNGYNYIRDELGGINVVSM